MTLKGHELTRRRSLLWACSCGVAMASRPDTPVELAQVWWRAHLEREIAAVAVDVPLAGERL